MMEPPNQFAALWLRTCRPVWLLLRISLPPPASHCAVFCTNTPLNPLLLITLSATLTPSPPFRNRWPVVMATPNRALLVMVTPPSRLRVPPWADMPLRVVFWIVKRLVRELPNISTTELRVSRPSWELFVMPPSPSWTFVLSAMTTPVPPLKMIPSMKIPFESVMFRLRRAGFAAVTVNGPGGSAENMVKLENPTMSALSLELQVTLMSLGPAGVKDASAAVMVTNVPGATPVQSTVTLLANIRPGARRNSTIHRTNLDTKVGSFISFSLIYFSNLRVIAHLQ